MEKCILISGTNRGLGRFLYENLKNDYVVKGTTRIQNDGFFDLDLQQTEKFETYIDTILKKCTPCIYIHNIGIGALGTFNQFSSHQINTLFTTNLFGPLLFIEKLLLKIKDKLNIILISSDVVKNYYPFLGIYSATKKALEEALIDLCNIHRNPLYVVYPPPLKIPSSKLPPTILKGEHKEGEGPFPQASLSFSCARKTLKKIIEIIKESK